MSEIFQFDDHVMILADYKDPAEHKHLASHLIFSLSGEMEWKIGTEKVACQGIVIGPSVSHIGYTGSGDCLIFMFTEISNYALSLRQKYLKQDSYAILDEEAVKRGRKLYYARQTQPKQADREILAAFGLDNTVTHHYDSRVQEVLLKIEQMETIPENAVTELSRQVFLSSSRLSHLFHKQTGMTLHSYLAFEKLRKTYRYFQKGNSITRSCLLAGFSSPSHCAVTCKKMFGISISEVWRTIAGK